jgi:hypothetical protein
MADALPDTALLEACVRVKAAGRAVTAAEVLQALLDEGHEGITLSDVKKACSKAAKMAAKDAGQAAAPAAAQTPTQPSEAKLAKTRRAAESAVKQVESAMMCAQRELRLAKDGDEFTAHLATANRGGAFIQGCSERAITGTLETLGEAAAGVVERRLEADYCTLEWMLLSNTAGLMPLPDEARTAAARRRDLLKSLRGGKDIVAMRACFLASPDVAAAPAAALEPEVTGEVQGDYGSASDYASLGGSARFASIDRAVARAAAAAGGGGAEDVG